jgi:hypothetical protein
LGNGKAARLTDVRAGLNQAASLARTNLPAAIVACNDAVEMMAGNISAGGLNTRALIFRGDLWRRAGNRREAEASFAAAGAFPARSADTPVASVDLSDYFNAGLDEGWHNPPSQSQAIWSLVRLPPGRQTLAGHEFDLRGLIQLSSKKVEGIAPEYPVKVEGIRIHQLARRLHFLHAEVWAARLPQGDLHRQLRGVLMKPSKDSRASNCCTASFAKSTFGADTMPLASA